MKPVIPNAAHGATAATERYTHDEIITISLDDCPETFTVSKALLCSASSYFIKALEGRFSEAASRTLEVPGYDRATFELFIFFVTTRKFPDYVSSTQCQALGRAVSSDAQGKLVRAWVFSDYLGMLSFHNQAMDSFLDCLELDSILASTVEMVFDFAPEESIPRTVAVSVCVWAQVFEASYSRTSMRRLSQLPEFLYEFTTALEEHYEREIEEDQYPHTQEDRSEYMVMQGGPIGTKGKSCDV